jgi:hypothetical protein
LGWISCHDHFPCGGVRPPYLEPRRVANFTVRPRMGGDLTPATTCPPFGATDERDSRTAFADGPVASHDIWQKPRHTGPRLGAGWQP